MSHPYSQHRDAERKAAKARYRAHGGIVRETEFDSGPLSPNRLSVKEASVPEEERSDDEDDKGSK